MSSGYVFDEKSAKRISDAVLAIEGVSDGAAQVGSRRPIPSGNQILIRNKSGEALEEGYFLEPYGSDAGGVSLVRKPTADSLSNALVCVSTTVSAEDTDDVPAYGLAVTAAAKDVTVCVPKTDTTPVIPGITTVGTVKDKFTGKIGNAGFLMLSQALPEEE